MQAKSNKEAFDAIAHIAEVKGLIIALCLQYIFESYLQLQRFAVHKCLL